MTKAELRKHYLEKRRLYPAEQLQLKSLQISTHFFTHIQLNAIQYLHSYLPIARQNEVDTWPVIQRILKNYPSLRVVLPRCDAKTRTMENFVYDENTELQLNAWGISEPTGGTTVTPELLDLIIIPLLAFDEKGYRVGYGKGFYDRFLARCRKDALKIGFSYESPTDTIADVDQYDVQMDYCITPDKVWRFSV